MLRFGLLVLWVVSSAVRSDECDTFARWFDDQLEEAEDVELTILGTLPEFLNGDLVRVGPTQVRTTNRNFTNFLDGFGRATRWSFDATAGTSTFTSKVMKTRLWNASASSSPAYAAAPRADIAPHIVQQPTSPRLRFPSAVLGLREMDNTDVMVWRFADDARRLLALTDFAAINELDARTLATLGPVAFTDELRGYVWSGSHPGVHPTTGAMLNVIAKPARPDAANGGGVAADSDGAAVGVSGASENGDEAAADGAAVNGGGAAADGGAEAADGNGASLLGFNYTMIAMGPDRFRTPFGSVALDALAYTTHSLAAAGRYAALVVPPVALSAARVGVTGCITSSALDLGLDGSNETGATVVHVFDVDGAHGGVAPVASVAVDGDGFLAFHVVNAFVEPRDADDADGGAHGALVVVVLRRRAPLATCREMIRMFSRCIAFRYRAARV